MKTEKQLDQFKANLYRFIILCGISKKLRKSFEMDCNFGDDPKREKKQQKLINDAEKLAQEMGFRLYVQGDPRGCALYLLTKDMDRTCYTNGLACYFPCN